MYARTPATVSDWGLGYVRSCFVCFHFVQYKCTPGRRLRPRTGVCFYLIYTVCTICDHLMAISLLCSAGEQTIASDLAYWLTPRPRRLCPPTGVWGINALTFVFIFSTFYVPSNAGLGLGRGFEYKWS